MSVIVGLYLYRLIGYSDCVLSCTKRRDRTLRSVVWTVNSLRFIAVSYYCTHISTYSFEFIFISYSNTKTDRKKSLAVWPADLAADSHRSFYLVYQEDADRRHNTTALW